MIGRPVRDLMRPEFIAHNGEVYIRADLVPAAGISCLDNAGDVSRRIMGTGQLIDLIDDCEVRHD